MKYITAIEQIQAVSVYTIVTTLSATVIGLVAVWVYHQYAKNSGSEPSERETDPDLLYPFVMMLLVFVASAIGHALITIDGPSELGFGLVTVILVSVPWSIFALRYSGRGYMLSRYRIALFSFPVVVIGVLMSIPVITESLPGVFPQSLLLALSFAQLGVVGVVFVLAGFILYATYRHGSLTLSSGAVVVFPMAIFLFVSQITRPSVPVFSTTILTISYVLLASTVVLSVTRYDVLSIRPGTGIIGERLVVEEMDEAVFVVGRRGDIARANETAEQIFGEDIEGEQFADVFDCPVTELPETSTIERWTDAGRMRFDPYVSEISSNRDRTLGNTVTLIDVTEREIRRQRIEVLNRILRHNLRNNIDVIKANAEVAADEEKPDETYFSTITTAADELEGLSANARRIEKLITDSRSGYSSVNLETFVEAVVEDITDSTHERMTVKTDVSPVTVRTNAGLLEFASKNIVENAIEHNDNTNPRVEIHGWPTETGVRLQVVDNGPGIPESERVALETGREDPLTHATSLGLWGVKWAVETLGGNLSLGESDLGGASVCIDLPGNEASTTD